MIKIVVLFGWLRIHCEILGEAFVVLDDVVVVVLSSPVVHVSDRGQACLALHLLFRINYKEYKLKKLLLVLQCS